MSSALLRRLAKLEASILREPCLVHSGFEFGYSKEEIDQKRQQIESCPNCDVRKTIFISFTLAPSRRERSVLERTAGDINIFINEMLGED